MAESKESILGNGDNGEHTEPQALDQVKTALKNLDINALPRAKDNNVADDGKYGSFVYDPNLLAPWDPGYGGAQQDDDEGEDSQVLHGAIKDKTDEGNIGRPPVNIDRADENNDAIQNQLLAQETSGAGGSTEMAVGAIKKKSKKKKSKSKRGLVQPIGHCSYLLQSCLTITLYAGSTYRL